MAVRHRGYDPNSDEHVYWVAPKWDPDGGFYDGVPGFGSLENIVIVEDDVTIIRSVGEQRGAFLVDAAGAKNGSPVGQGDAVGVSVEGFDDVNIYWVLSDPAASAEVKIWFYDGNVWVPEANNTQTLDNADGRDVFGSVEIVGGFSRVYAEVTSAPSSGSLTMWVTPHNEGYVQEVWTTGWNMDDKAYHSLKGGRDWTAVDLTTSSVSYYGGSVLDSMTAWFVGDWGDANDIGTVIKTSDGGYSWTRQDPSGAHTLQAVDFVDDQHGWVAGKSNSVYRTTDGGNSWTDTATPHNNHANGIEMLDTQTAVVVMDYGKAYKTTDGGSSWTEVIDNADDYDLIAVHFLDDQEGWIVGGYGVAYHTTDGGDTWDLVDTGTDVQLWDAHFLSPDVGFVVGQTVDQTIRKTEDGGATWSDVSTPVDFGLRSIVFADDQNGWAVGWDGGVMYTPDAGDTWKDQSISGVSSQLQTIETP